MQHQLDNEKELLEQIAAGNEVAFKKLYDHYIHLLVPFLRKLTGADMPTDEIIQETFIRIWLSRDKLPDVQYPRTWIFEVASHAAFTWLKKDLRYQQVISAQLPGDTDQYAVDQHLYLLETRRLIGEAVSQLSDQRRKIYRLSREQGMTIPAIAGELGLSPNTVKNTLVKSLAAIREHLSRSGYQLPLFLILLLR